MNRYLPLAVVLCVASLITAQQSPYRRVWVATTDGVIRIFDLTAEGRLQLRSRTAGPRGLRFLAFHPRLPVVYGSVGKSVQMYRIADGTPKAATKQTSGVGGTHIEVDPAGRFVFIASYGGGAVLAFPLDENGVPGEKSFDLRAPDELCRKAHQVRAHPGGSFVYAPCLGDDVVQIMKITDRGVQSLGRVRLRTGSGPRHMDFDPNGRHAYVVNELSSSIYAFRVDPSSGSLTEIQAVTALPEGRTEFSRSSDIHVSADGRFLYAVHREPLNQIVTFAIGADGRLAARGRTPTGGVHSRSFALTTDGRFVVLAHSKTKNVIVRRIDAKTGVVGEQTDEHGVEATAIFAGFEPRRTVEPDDPRHRDLPTLQVGPHAFHRRELANGLRAVAVRDTGEKVSVFMVISVGKRQETHTTTGLAHLTEHAMYAGTAKTGLGRHDRLIHAMGGESNAFTREDYTLFYDHGIPSAQLDRVLAMEADRLRGLTFDVKSVRFERERLRREEARTWKPRDARRELLESCIYKSHNYGAGLLDAQGHTLAPGLSVETVKSFYDEFYHPDHTAVVIVGNVDPKHALDAIATAFGQLPRGPKRAPLPEEPDLTAPREVVVKADLHRDRCHLVWLVPAMGDPDRPALTVLARILSRRSAADGSPIEASMGSRVDRELFQIAATGQAARQDLDTLLQVTREKLLDPDEVAQTVRLQADEFATLPLRARPYFSLGGTFGVYEVLGHAELVAGYAAAVRTVTPAKLREVARRHLDPKRQFTLLFQSTGRAQEPLPNDLRELARAAEEAEAAGDLDRAITAYTRLLDARPNRMFTVIYYSQRGGIYVKKKDYDGAIGDYEAALRIIDYPAVRKLLHEARELKAGKNKKQPRPRK